MRSGNAKGAVMALAAMGLYASHDAIIKSLTGVMSSVQVLFFSALLTFPLVSFLLLSARRVETLRPQHPGWVALRSACLVGQGLCGFYAFSTLPLAQVYAILFASPLLITVLSIPMLGERVGVHRWSAILVGLAGVMVVLQPGRAPLELGHLAALGAACLGAMGAVIVRKLGSGERAVIMVLWPMMGHVVISGILMGFDYTPIGLGALLGSLAIAVLGLAASFLIIYAYQAGEAAVIAPMSYSQIIWATFYSWYFFDEALDSPTLVGASIVISSGMYLIWRESSGGGSANRPVISARTATATAQSPRSSLLARMLRR